MLLNTIEGSVAFVVKFVIYHHIILTTLGTNYWFGNAPCPQDSMKVKLANNEHDTRQHK
jgi:hypothetical protein